MEKECISAKMKGVRVPPYSEVRAKVLKIFREPVPLAKGVKKRGMVKYLVRIDRIYQYVDREVFGVVDKLMNPEEINEFYAEVLKLAGIPDYKDLLGRLRGLRKVLRKLWKAYRLKIKSSLDAREANDKAREFVGRVISLVRRIRKDLDALRVAIMELRKLPCFDFEQPRIVVSGMPQVGKSTFVRRVSTAEPEVSPFPFTSKEVILGHARKGFLTLQFIDTPGILDRPFSELNRIERKAVTAIRFLGDILLYLIDPRPGSYYSLDEQIDLLSSIHRIFRGRKIIVLINKIDEVSKDRLDEVLSKVREVFDGEIYLISALKGTGVDEVMERIYSLVIDEYMKSAFIKSKRTES